MTNNLSWLDEYFGPATIQKDGVAVGRREKINFTGDVSVTDDSVNGRVNIVLSGAPPISNNGTGALNDVSTTSTGAPVSAIRFGGAAPSVTGFTDGTAGRRLVVMATGGPLILRNESASSAAANRIITGTGGDLTIEDEQSAFLVYDATSSRWRVVAGGASSGGNAETSLTKAMADANQTLSAGEAASQLIKTTGTLTAERTLTFPLPTSTTNYQRTILNACTGFSIQVAAGSATAKVEIEPGAKMIVRVTDTGVYPVVDLPLDPRDYGCPWNGVDDDLPGFEAMLATIPVSRNYPTLIQLPKGKGYFSDNLDIDKLVSIRSYGESFTSDPITNGIEFPTLKGLIIHGAVSSPTPGGYASHVELESMNIFGTQAIVSDSTGNWGKAMRQISTTIDTWPNLPATVQKGHCAVRSGATVGSIGGEYYGDGHTRNTTHRVMFRCTTSGTKGSSEPSAFATATVANIGTTISAVGGTAVWTVESIPKDYENNKSYAVGERVIIPGDNDHVFEALTSGTSLPFASTTVSALSDGDPIPSATLNVASTAGFPNSGIICIEADSGRQYIRYSSKTSTSFTGIDDVQWLKASSGTAATGDVVTGPYRYAQWGVPVRCARSFVQPAFAEEFYDRQTRIAAGSDGATLPQSTITVESTEDFADSGTINIWTGSAYTSVTYTGKTATTFTGCSGGTGTLTQGNEVGAGIRWRHIYSALVTVLGNWAKISKCHIAGSTGPAIWIQSAYQRGLSGGSNFWSVRDCILWQCNGGVLTNGSDTNGGESAQIQIGFVGAGRTNTDMPDYLNLNGGVWADGRWGNGGYAVKDRTLGTNNHRNYYTQFMGGMPYRNDLFGEAPFGNATRWEYIANETELSGWFLSPAVLIFPVHGYRKDSTASLLSGIDGQNLRFSTATQSDPDKRLRVVLGEYASVASTASVLKITYDQDTYGVGVGFSGDLLGHNDDWVTFGKIGAAGFFDQQLFAWPRPAPAGATWPSGQAVGVSLPMWIKQDAVWIGQDPTIDPPSVGFATAAPTTGYWVRGSVMHNRNAAVGQPLGWVCTATGSPGTWVAMANL